MLQSTVVSLLPCVCRALHEYCIVRLFPCVVVLCPLPLLPYVFFFRATLSLGGMAGGTRTVAHHVPAKSPRQPCGSLPCCVRA
jgi:hypothetical protein